MQIFVRYPVDIGSVSYRYLIGVLEISDGSRGDIWWVSWRYLQGDPEILNGCP